MPVKNHRNTSENILKLRELTEKITETPPNSELEDVLHNIKITIDESLNEINVSNSIQKKLKNYESLYEKITNILKTVYI